MELQFITGADDCVLIFKEYATFFWGYALKAEPMRTGVPPKIDCFLLQQQPLAYGNILQHVRSSRKHPKCVICRTFTAPTRQHNIPHSPRIRLITREGM